MTAVNGRLPTSSLVTVQGTMQLETKAGASWKRLVADIRTQTGITAVISKDGAYRTYDRQKILTGKGNHQYKPGYSIHGLGRCVDINNWATIGTKRLDRIANAHGWKRTIAGEPWHYQYSPNRDTRINKPSTPTKLRNLMSDFRIMRTQGNPARWTAFDGIRIYADIDEAKLDVLRAGRITADTIKQGDKEKDADWKKRKDTILAAWKAERDDNLRIFGGSGTATVDYAKVASEVAKVIPSVQAIGAEVIRQQKLPGN